MLLPRVTGTTCRACLFLCANANASSHVKVFTVQKQQSFPTNLKRNNQTSDCLISSLLPPQDRRESEEDEAATESPVRARV